MQVRTVTRLRDYLLFMLMERNMIRPCSLYQLPAEPFLPGADVRFYQESMMYEVPVFSDKNVTKTSKATYLHLKGMFQWKI